jgi:DNA-binding NarL/FixJ family response regulator
MIRVVIADDQHLVRGGFALILASAPDIEVVGEAADGVEALTATREHRPDVVLMDIRMPRMDGVEATRHITAGAATRDVKVLVLTTFDTDQEVYQALQAGAYGFLLKDTAPADLIAAVRAVARGDALLAPSVTRRLIERFLDGGGPDRARAAQPAAAPPDLPALTPRERDILQAVADGLSNHEIAAQLHLSYSTVKTHVSHLLAKLDVRDRTQLVALAHRAGIVGDEG